MTRVRMTLGAAAAVVAALVLFPGMGTAHGGKPEDPMAGLALSMKNPMRLVSSAKATKLSIVHAVHGCHVWTDGNKKAPGVKLMVKRGTRLTVFNADIDAHKLVRLSGPKIWLGPALTMGKSVKLKLAKRGVYRLMTKKVEGAGPEYEVKTTGPDYVLGLTIVVR